MNSKQGGEAVSPRSGARPTRPPKAEPDRPARPKPRTSRVSVRQSEPQLRQEQIRIAAYYRAQHRGFAPNHELDDWLAAEAEFDERLV
jgi:hypothetical protein